MKKKSVSDIQPSCVGVVFVGGPWDGGRRKWPVNLATPIVEIPVEKDIVEFLYTIQDEDHMRAKTDRILEGDQVFVYKRMTFVPTPTRGYWFSRYQYVGVRTRKKRRKRKFNLEPDELL